ncbi:ATP-dependent Clp protease proteolytic subunit [bacterium]|nr:ATP-dependent Clp protease proteolytic subunit [bacterium]
MANVIIPTIIEKDGMLEKRWDPYSRLLQDRIVFVYTALDDFVSNLVIAQLLFLQMDNPDKDISIYINSPGGHVTAGLAIYDTIRFVKCDVATYCIGQAASMSAVLLAAGAKGKRFALPHSRVLIHQPLGGVHGQATDVSIQAEEIIRLRKELNAILALHTGHTVEEIEKDTDREKFMSAEEAKAYGLVDEVLASKKEVPEVK